MDSFKRALDKHWSKDPSIYNWMISSKTHLPIIAKFSLVICEMQEYRDLFYVALSAFVFFACYYHLVYFPSLLARTRTFILFSQHNAAKTNTGHCSRLLMMMIKLYLLFFLFHMKLTLSLPWGLIANAS
jgi:hypothetical protein